MTAAGTTAQELPSAAAAVVIGGGVGGASIAYHLAELGLTDTVVVEQHDLGDGTTWHSAGFVGQLRSSISQTRMIMYSTELYERLGAETGLDPGWRGVGGLRIATTPERVEELRRQQSAAATYGLELDLLTPEETHERLPLLAVEDVLASAWLPGDGYVDPELLAEALAQGAARHGATFHTGVRVTGFELDGDRVVGVITDRGTIATETAVIAAGAASGALGRLAGASIPIVPMRHQYLVTEPFDPPVAPDATTVRDPDSINYFRPEAGGLLVGGYSRDPVTWDVGRAAARPADVVRTRHGAVRRVLGGSAAAGPGPAGAEIAKVVNGPEAFTPDGEFILGETPEVAGLWVAAGFCVHGLAGAGGVGRVIAEWIVEGMPFVDPSAMDIRRFGSHYASRHYARVRCARCLLALLRHRLSRRGAAGRSAAAAAAGLRPPRRASMPASARRPAGSGSTGSTRTPPRAPGAFGPTAGRAATGRRRSGPSASRRATPPGSSTSPRSRSSTSRGPGATDALNHLCANDIDKPVGSAVYTQLLNERGGIEADLTVTRVGEESFRIVTGTAFGTHDLAWIRRHLPDQRSDGSIVSADVSGSRACFCLWGPRARDILQPLTDADLSNDAHPFLQARPISVGPVPVFAQRITFVGELGWELYCGAEFGRALWDLLWEAGRPEGMVAGGYRAIDSMRLEKGYRVWGTDITPETTPYEAGLGFAVQLEKAGGFIGLDALLEQRAQGRGAAPLPRARRAPSGRLRRRAGPRRRRRSPAASPRAASAIGSAAASPSPTFRPRSRRHARRGGRLRPLGRRRDREGPDLRPEDGARQGLMRSPELHPPAEVEHRSIEGGGLFDVALVAGVRQDDQLGAIRLPAPPATAACYSRSCGVLIVWTNGNCGSVNGVV